MTDKNFTEGSEDRKRNAMWAQITSYEKRAKETKNDIKKDHLMKMASELRAKLPTTDEEKLEESLAALEEAIAGDIGALIKSAYQKIYDAGDDAIEFMYYDSPIFAQYWDEYEGDLDSIIAEVDPSELQVILAELQSAAEDQDLEEGAYDQYDLGTDDDDYESQDQGFYVCIGSEDDGGFIGMIIKDGGKWREVKVAGNAPHNWGSGYMSYLTPAEVMQWLRKDYGRYSDVEGPFDDEESAREYAQSQYGLDEGVAEGFGDVVKGVKRAVKGKEHPDVVASKHLGRALGHYHQGSLPDAEKETKRYNKVQSMNKGIKTLPYPMKEQGVAEGEVVNFPGGADVGKQRAVTRKTGNVTPLKPNKAKDTGVKITKDAQGKTVAQAQSMHSIYEGNPSKPEQPEADYGDDYQAMVSRVKKLAGLGPLKTVYDPAKRVYKNVPKAEQPKK